MFSELPPDKFYVGMTRWDDGTRSVRCMGVGPEVREAITAHLTEKPKRAHKNGGRS